MENNAEKHLDKLSRKIMGKTNLDTPSKDFTSKLLSQIDYISNSRAFVYKPPISKPVWLVMAVAVLAITGYSVSNSKGETSNWSKMLNLKNIVSKHFEDLLTDFQFSEISLYAFLMFCGMLYLQILIIKTQRN